jgi:hypothetical protein
MKPTTDPRVDAYIENSAAFARPILRHWRELVHQACPAVVETTKWGMPFFTHHGILCYMAAFTAHGRFGFWHQGMKAELGPLRDRLHRITRPADLPDDHSLFRLFKAAVKLNEGAKPARPGPTAGKKTAPRPPADLAAALRQNPAANATFAKFSPSHRREYIAWITDAKRPETRERRLAATLAQLAGGRPRHWKYQGR